MRDGGSNPFAALYADPARLKEFLKAMSAISHGANLAIAGKFPWSNYRTAVDVGTAQGDLITQVALANPHIEGTGFDLPEVGPTFEEYVEANRLSGRVKFMPGSFMDQTERSAIHRHKRTARSRQQLQGRDDRALSLVKRKSRSPG
jgi:hypothetical protein